MTDDGWSPTWMLTTRIRMLSDSEWSLEHNQRVHVHHGTAEVLARCALLEDAPLSPGDTGWVQLRLEAPIVARGRDRFVIRAYSPVTTIGGGSIAESHPPKRNRLDGEERAALAVMVEGTPAEAVAACLDLAGWAGVRRDALPVRTGFDPGTVDRALDELGPLGCVMAGAHVFGAAVRREAVRRILKRVEAAHAEDSLRASIPLATVRAGLPSWSLPELADAVIDALVEEGSLEAPDGGVRRRGHESRLTPEQETASKRLLAVLREEDLATPLVDELPEELTHRVDFWPLVRRLETLGAIRQVADGLYITAQALDRAEERIRSTLGGRTGLGPSAFREVLPVTRKHLIPLLNYFDGRGTTLRRDEGRDVPEGP